MIDLSSPKTRPRFLRFTSFIETGPKCSVLTRRVPRLSTADPTSTSRASTPGKTSGTVRLQYRTTNHRQTTISSESGRTSMPRRERPSSRSGVGTRTSHEGIASRSVSAAKTSTAQLMAPPMAKFWWLDST